MLLVILDLLILRVGVERNLFKYGNLMHKIQSCRHSALASSVTSRFLCIFMSTAHFSVLAMLY